jgi:hypothetical protein
MTDTDTPSAPPAPTTPTTPAVPYPPSLRFRVTGFRYHDHLEIVRYAYRPKGSDRNADWQLCADYAADIDLSYREDGADKRATWRLTAPKGLYTDLSSIPAFGRWIVSKVGPHLEASILHDWLYVAWTDHRPLDAPRFSDFVFANAVLAAGIRELDTLTGFKRFVILFAVDLVGWWLFMKKDKRLGEELPKWLPNLNYRPHKPIPLNDRLDPPLKTSGFTHAYNAAVFLVCMLFVLLGLGIVAHWIDLGGLSTALTVAARWAGTVFLWVLSAIGGLLVAALLAYLAVRLLIVVRRALDR